MPIWTNKFNANQSLAAALSNDSYSRGKADISITGLSRPVQMAALEERYKDKIVQDVSDALVSIRGRIAHSIVEKFPGKNEIVEERMFAEIEGWTISGAPDKYEALYLEGGVLADYKFPTLSSFLFGFQRDKGLKQEWIEQGGGYRWLLWNLKRINITLNKIEVTLIEWSKRHARTKRDYPPSPFFTFNLPLTPLNEVEDWIRDRVRAHKAARALPDDKLPECTPEERWQSPGIWAVMKEGRKNAVKLCDTEKEADDLVSKNGSGHYKVYRASETIRCLDYCSVSSFCHQLKREQPQGIDFIHSGGY